MLCGTTEGRRTPCRFAELLAVECHGSCLHSGPGWYALNDFVPVLVVELTPLWQKTVNNLA